MEHLRSALRDVITTAKQCNEQKHYKDPVDCMQRVVYIAERALVNNDAKMVSYPGGKNYEYIGLANPAGDSKGETPKEVYRGEDGRLWFRSVANFADKFDEVQPS
jgi:hypothetical protein